MKKVIYCFVFAAFLFSGFAMLVHAADKAGNETQKSVKVSG